MSKTKCTAVGDMILQRALPCEEDGYDGFAAVRDFIAQGDFRFANLETTVHNYECAPTEIGGGGYICMKPELLGVLKSFGFNALNTGNNHTLDYTQRGVELTLDYLDKAGFLHAGSGRNLAEAAEPVYLDTPSGRYAMIAAACVYRDYEMAGEQTKNMPGRPGLNGLHSQIDYYVTPKQMEALREIAAATHINGKKDVSRKEGFSPALKEGQFDFGGLSFYESDTPRRESKINKRDMKRITDAIAEARYQADYVIVSFHAHDMEGEKKETPDMFLREFARGCVDAGADAVVGHGPHLLRPLEIYKGKPIFYSLGNFIFMNLNCTRYPKQYYDKYGVDLTENLTELLNAVTLNGTRGLQTDPKMMSAVIPYWEAEDGKLTKLTLMPVDLGFGKEIRENGWPRFAPDCGALEFLRDISAEYGTEIKIKDGIGEVVLK